jgi:ParB family chromosome partitioning protein
MPSKKIAQYVDTPPTNKPLEYGWVRIEKIRSPHSDDGLDQDLVSSIAESMQVHGQVSPIVVRRVIEQRRNGGESARIALVAGGHRLQAAKLIGQEKIACVYLEGDETAARIVQIAENLFRKDLTVLKRAEMLTEWLSLTLANLSGQVVQKGKLGAPSRGIARAAKALPVVGRSVEARRKILDRAVRIARLPPEVKKAAISADLDNNQRALLKIAKANGRKARLRRVEELAGQPQNSNALPEQTGKASASSRDGLQGKSNSVDQSPPLLQCGTDDAIGDDKPTAGNRTTKTPVKRETTCDDLEAFWNPDGRELWAYAPFSERERFIEKLRRAKCKAQVDVVAFLRDVFRGRYEVAKRDLYALAKGKGLAKGPVRKALGDLTYQAKRKGQGSRAVWYFRNKDRNWEDQLPIVTNAELAAAGAAQSDPVLKKSVTTLMGIENA